MQDLFDRAWDRLVLNFSLGQSFKVNTHHKKDRASGPEQYAIYHLLNERNELVNACVIGWMMPFNDEFRSLRGETEVLTPYMIEHELHNWFKGIPIRALREMQDIHDEDANWTSVEVMERKLQTYAAKHKLNLP